MPESDRSSNATGPPLTRWHFVRHAPVVGAGTGVGGMLYRTRDEPADTSNSAAFAWLAGWLPRGAFLLTSGLRRTEATADALLTAGYEAQGRGCDDRFEEQDYGDWHGAEIDQAIAAKYERHKFWFHGAAVRPEGGESFLGQCGRVSAALEDWSARVAGRSIVCVAHGGTIRAVLAHALGIDGERALTLSVENLSVTRVDYLPGPGLGGNWRTVYVNRRPG